MRARVAAAALAAAILMSGCGGDDEEGGAANGTGDAGDATVVTLRQIKFNPSTVTIDAGETVRWVWDDGAVQHDVQGEGFKSELKAKGDFEHTFEDPGTYDYICTIHPQMKGTVEVN